MAQGFHGTMGDGKPQRLTDKKTAGYSRRPCLLRLQTIPVCSFELNPSFS